MLAHHRIGKGALALAVILSILFCMFPLSSASEVSLPPSIEFSGKKDDVIIRVVTLHNSNETNAIVVNLSVAEGITTAPPDSVTIGNLTSATLGISYTLPYNVSTGLISFSWNVEDEELNISVVAEEDLGNGGNGEEPPEIPVSFFPAQPVSGSSIAIFFAEQYGGITANGFLYCNGYMYMVNVEDGFAIVHLDKDAYGPATLYLFGGAISSEDSIKTFTIEKGATALLSVSVPASTATIDNDVTATVTYGGEPLTNQEVQVQAPDDAQETCITNNVGTIEFTVDAIGKWKLTVVAMEQMATASVTVSYGVLALSILEDDPQVGDTITILTEADAEIEVKIDGIFENDYIASSNGTVKYTLSKGGRYTLEGYLERKKAVYSFQVPGKAVISVLDLTTRMPVGKIEPGQRYIVEVTDSSGNTIDELDALWISNPMGTREYLPLTEGSGTWMPVVAGSYVLTVESVATSSGNSRYVLIKQSAGPTNVVLGAVLFVVIFLVIILLLLVYSKRRGVPLRITLKSLNPFSRTKKVELPIEG